MIPTRRISDMLHALVHLSPLAPPSILALQWGVFALLAIISAFGQRWFVRVPLLWLASGITIWLRVRFVKRQVALFARAQAVQQHNLGVTLPPAPLTIDPPVRSRSVA